MRDKLIELLESAESAVYWNSTDKNFIEKIADYLLANGVIVPPCKVGDSIVWDNGVSKSEHEVKGFNYNPSDLGLRFIIGNFSPVVDHKNIVGIVPREEAERALREVQDDA